MLTEVTEQPKTKLIGLPDGGAGIIFLDHDAHHNPDGTIQVTWSAETLDRMIELAWKATRTDEMCIEVLPDTNDE